MGDGRLIVQTSLSTAQKTAQSLAPTLKSILRDANWEPNAVELVAVTSGPGSFTGLRAGVTSAKVFAYATGAQVLAINTLEVIAAQVENASGELWAVMDAQRKQVFASKFAPNKSGTPEMLLPTQILDDAAMIGKLASGELVTGTGLAKLLRYVPSEVRVGPENSWQPQAATLGRLAFAKYRSGMRNDVWQLAPEYYRKSAAEEKFDQGLLK